MLAEFGGFLEKIIASTWNMLNSSSPWIIFSFLVAGLLHEFLKPEKIQKTAIGSGKISGVFWTTISGMFIPICSCGTIPLGISMYYSGAYLGPTLAFMTSTPMINPIALLLAYGLLGKEIATIYLITGFVAPMVIGMIANIDLVGAARKVQSLTYDYVVPMLSIALIYYVVIKIVSTLLKAFENKLRKSDIR